MRITFGDGVQEAIEEHAFSRVDVEVGGFLVGIVGDDEVRVEASVPATRADEQQTHLTFTHDTWDDLHRTMESEHQGRSVVGWYHTHPAFGLFLSDYDTFIQEHFFSAPGQFAMVVDPVIGRYGFFHAADGEATQFEEAETLLPALRGVENEDEAAEVRAAIIERQASAAAPRGGRRWVTATIAAVVAAVVAGSVAWFAGSLQGRDAGRETAQQRVTELESLVEELSIQPAPAPAPEASSEPTQEPTPEATPEPVPTVALVAYTVRPGDSWWLIAARYLGDGTRWTELRASNAEVEGLEPGQIIGVPLPVIVEGSAG